MASLVSRRNDEHLMILSSEQLHGDNQNFVVQIQDNQRLPEYVNNYYANSCKIRDFFPALGERLELNHDSLRRSSECLSDVLIAQRSFLTQELLELARLTQQQSLMQATLQSNNDALDVKLDCFSARRKVSAVFFTIVAAFCAALAAVTATSTPKRPAVAAMAAAASILSGALGKWIDSLVKNHVKPVKKRREIIRVMIVGGKLTIGELNAVSTSARDLRSVLENEMIDDVGDIEVSLRKNLTACFKELQAKAYNGSWVVISTTDSFIRTVLRNLE